MASARRARQVFEMSCAAAWMRTLPSLADHRLRVRQAENALYDARLDELAQGLDELCQLTERRHERARQSLLAFIPLIADVDHLEQIALLRDRARRASLPAASRLLRCSTRRGHLLDEPVGRDRGSEHIQQRKGRPLTLGERRALARQPDRATVLGLARDPHPMVVRLLLQNPRITERDVLGMAARRPALPDVLREIARAWVLNPRVRNALALNPGTPPAVSVPLLTMLSRPDLEEVVVSEGLRKVVRACAHELLERRPPMGEVEPVVHH